MNFASDNVVGAASEVLASLTLANQGAEASYGADSWCLKATQAIEKVFDHPVKAFYVTTGTVANSLALSALTPPWGGIFCHKFAHINADESTAPELFTNGARILALPDDGDGGKVTPKVLLEALKNEPHPPHNIMPKVLSLTQITESGLVYTVEELAALCQTAKAHGLYVHLDGARFANAVVSLGCQPADISWRAGVDVLTLGASKNGALIAESVIFFNTALAKDFEFRVKRAGQMMAKARYVGAQFVAWLDNNLWLTLANHANTQAKRLSEGLLALPGVRKAWPTNANEIFIVLPKKMADCLEEQGAIFYDWYAASLPIGMSLADDERFIRLVCSFQTDPVKVDEFIRLAKTAV